MNTDRAAAALNTISVAFGELAEALAEGALAPALAAPRAVDEPPAFPPLDYEVLPVAVTPNTEPFLSRCPAHDRPWTVKTAGVSKVGKPYNAFYKCDGKDSDGSFCPRKPVKAWADAHPIAA